MSTAGAEPIPDRVGARFDVRAHIGSHAYSKPTHTVKGTITLVNKAERRRRVNCMIAVQYQDMNGQARMISWSSLNGVYVGPNSRRTIPYTDKMKDKKHRWANVPVRANGHCRVVR